MSEFEVVFKFLEKISRNNNREWLEKKKALYLSAKDAFEKFVLELYPGVVNIDESIAGQDPKKLIFRIYRDIRFSKDKTPYKTFMSVGFSSTGKGTGKPGYYLQVEPGNKTSLAIGLYKPEQENLTKVRQEIDYNGKQLEKIFNDKKFKKTFGDFWDDEQLKNIPKGYPKDHPHIKWLKLKSFVISHPFTDEEVLDKKFQKKVLEVLTSAKPVVDFLNQALD